MPNRWLSRVCVNIFLYGIPWFRVQMPALALRLFYRLLSLSRNLAILLFIRPEGFPSIIFQIICLQSFFLKTNKPEQLNVGLFDYRCMALQWLRSVVAGQSARMLWMENIEFYLGLSCTEWHWVTSFLLCIVFAYHCFSKNSWYLYEVLVPSTVYKLKIKSVVK